MKHISSYKIYENINTLNADLHNAILSDDIYEVKKALVAGADVNCIKGTYTPTMLAAKYNAIKSLKFLIEAGADLNLKTEYDDTALRLSAVHGNVECFKLLINAGADLNIPYKIGSQIFISVFLYNSMKFVQWFRSEEGQDFLMPKFPELVNVYKKQSILIKQSIKDKYPYIFTGADLNLL